MTYRINFFATFITLILFAALQLSSGAAAVFAVGRPLLLFYSNDVKGELEACG